MNFASTRYARDLFESAVPRAVKSLERIADALEEANELKKQSMEESSNEQKQSEDK